MPGPNAGRPPEDRQHHGRPLGAARFIIIGVQKPRLKRLPQVPDVWQFEVTPAPGLIEQGRKKYERLMKAYIQQQARPITVDQA